MNILNIFKKESSRTSDSKKINVQSLNKNQLKKVIGGDGSDALIEEGVRTGTIKRPGQTT